MIRIPEISDERLTELCARIKPVVRFKDAPFYIKPVDLKKTAYTWDPKRTKKATGLVPIKQITTFHTYGYYGFFKPSIAEIIAQIPEDIVDQITAFEIVDHPKEAKDLNKQVVSGIFLESALNEGFHVATTQLYGQELGDR